MSWRWPLNIKSHVKGLALAAVEQGNLDELKRLVRLHGLAYISPSGRRMALLSAAIRSQQTAIAKYLISAGVLKDKNGRWTDFNPLLTAVDNKALDIVEALLKAGVPATVRHNIKLQPRVPSGDTPLYCALKRRSLEIVRMLLKHGADPNELVGTYSIRSPLFEAVAANRPDFVTMLLDAGADVNFTTKEGYTALNRALVNESWDVLRVLLRYKPYVDCDALVKEVDFCIINSFKAVELFAENGIPISALEGDNDHTMFKAIRDGNIQVLKELLKSYDLIEQSEEKRITALHIAAYYQQAEVAELLIKRGANPLALDSREETPIRYLARNNAFSMLALFLTTQKCKDEALIDAVKYDRPEFVELLLERGANLFINGRTSGETGYHGALPMISRSFECTELLVEYGGDPNAYWYDSLKGKISSLLHSACFNHELRMLGLLLDYGADINAHNETVFEAVVLEIIYERLRADDVVASFEEIFQVLLRHIEKLKALDFHISIANRRKYEQMTSHEIRNSTGKFEKEVALMKEEKIDGESSLYDGMRASGNKLARFAGNGKLMEKVLSGGYSGRFPSFNSFIIGKFKVGKIRRKFLERGCESLLSLFPNLPFLCIQNIVKYLKNDDLNTLSMQ